MVTCFRVRTNRPTKHLNLHVSSISPLPKSYTDAFNDPNYENAMCDEYNALIRNKTWTLVPRPTDANIVRCIFVTHDSSRIFLSQRKYATEILERAHMVNFNPSRTFVDTESKLGDDGDPISDSPLYQSLAGSLQYLTFTHRYKSYVVQQVCLYMQDPRKPHFSAFKQILRYVRGTLDHGLPLFSSSTTSLVAYSNADWAGCPTTWRSTSEYRGFANVFAETCWLRNLLRELHTPLSSATLVYCDNLSAVYLSSNPVQH
ncbi:ribonuclease H-like domain-containing protein [Tanacetum coccineum]